MSKVMCICLEFFVSVTCWLIAALFISSLLLVVIELHKIFVCFPEQKEHKELIPLIRKSSSPSLVHCQTSNHISSQHKRKLRSIALCPVNDQLFVTRFTSKKLPFWRFVENLFIDNNNNFVKVCSCIFLT